MSLMGRHEFDGAVQVSVFVPDHKRRHSLTGLLLTGKWDSQHLDQILEIRCACRTLACADCLIGI